MSSVSLLFVPCLLVPDSASPWTVACQAPLSMVFSRQERRHREPFPSPSLLILPPLTTCL